MEDGRRIVIACGGTGGHIFPALALREGLLARGVGAEFQFVCSERPFEVARLREEGIEPKVVRAAPMPRRLSPAVFPFAAKTIASVRDASRFLREVRPDLVVGFGGYSAFPVVWAARRLGMKTLIHEQNRMPGVANRLLARGGSSVAAAFPEARPHFGKRRVWVTGNPVRLAFDSVERDEARGRLGLSRASFVLLVLGGSQGATAINRAVEEALSHFSDGERERLECVHVAGPRDAQATEASYESSGVRAKVFPFFREIWLAFRAADLLVGRAGAMTVWEMAACGLPGILVPYPGADGHQRANARIVEQLGSAIVLEQNDALAPSMQSRLRMILNDPGMLDSMRAGFGAFPKPELQLADLVVQMLGGTRS